jgi:hypothetical protein
MVRILIVATLLASALCGAIAIWAIATGDYFRSPVRLAVYIILPSAVALIGLACLFLGGRARALFVAYGVAGATGAVGCELFLQWQRAPEPRMLGAAGERDAAASARLRHEGGRAFPHLCSALAEARPRAGSVVSPIVVDGAPVQILTGLADNRLALDGIREARTDSHGFNNPPDQWRPGEVQILVVGDSFAFGVGAPFGAGFVDHLRTRTGITVNLACGGNGPLSELGTLVEYGRILKPKLVVWTYFEGNDLAKDLGREMETAILPRYLAAAFTQDLYARRNAIDRAIEAYLAQPPVPTKVPGSARRPGLSWASVARLEYLRTALGMSYGYRTRDLRDFARVLARAKEEVNAWGGRLVFAYVPGEARYASATARWDADGYKQGVVSVVRGFALEIVDFDAEFRRVRPDPRQLFAGHFTPEGHRIAGDVLAERLRRHMP